MSEEKSLTKNLMCVVMRNGVHLWLEEERSKTLQDALQGLTSHKFVKLPDTNESINTADISGVFKASTMEELNKMKHGQWKCQEGQWHERAENCSCPSAEDKARSKRRKELIEKCGKCNNGYVESKNGMTLCECVKSL